MRSQLSGLRPMHLDRRKAISGLIELCPLMSREKVEGDTLSRKATLRGETPNGFKYTSLINSPGWGGLCIAISDNPHNLQYRHSRL